ncbi:MAG TPA: hypothetical protein EYQ64_15805 [Gemmatimonadetes bacterium]|nr:hypothetical protein [Gemmatimonadota bacterium]
MRRGVALLIDIFLVGLITVLTSGFGFVIGVVAAAFFFNRATKSERSGGSKMLRIFLGCMGVSALSLTAVVVLGIWYVNTTNDDFNAGGGGVAANASIEDGADRGLQLGAPGGASAGGLRSILGGLQDGAQLTGADDPDEAVALAVGVGRRLLELAAGDTPQDVEDLLFELIPEEVGDVGRGEILARAMAELDPARVVPADPAEDLPSTPSEVGAAELALAQALELVSDTIGELERDLARATGDLGDTRDALDDAQQQGGVIE